MIFLQQVWEMKVLESELARSPQRIVEETNVTARRKRRDKPYSQRHERRLKKQRLENCSSALSFLSSEGLTPVKLVVKKTQEVPPLNVLDVVLDLDSERIGQTEEELILMMLYVKDKYHVSGQAYHEMASLCKQMPRHYKLKRKITELNSLWKLDPTPEGTCGIQQNLEERLRICLERMVSD